MHSATPSPASGLARRSPSDGMLAFAQEAVVETARQNALFARSDDSSLGLTNGAPADHARLGTCS
jgi:hypothetical protein